MFAYFVLFILNQFECTGHIVSILKNFIKSGNRESADDVAFIANELLENAVKNSNNKKIMIECRIEDDVAEIKVSNRINRGNYAVVKNKIQAACEKNAEKLDSEKFREKSFWEDEKGAMGLIMINERCEGRIHVNYKNLSIVVSCSVPVRELK